MRFPSDLVMLLAVMREFPVTRADQRPDWPREMKSKACKKKGVRHMQARTRGMLRHGRQNKSNLVAKG